MQRFNVFLMLLQGNMEKGQTDPYEGLNLWPSHYSFGFSTTGLCKTYGRRVIKLHTVGCWDDNKVVSHFIILGLKSYQNKHIFALMSRNADYNKNSKTLPIIWQIWWFGQIWQFCQNLVKFTKLCRGTVLKLICGGLFGKNSPASASLMRQ